MQLTDSEKIKFLVDRRGLTLTEIAKQTNQSRQNLSNKLKRDNFSKDELKKIAEILDCEYKTCFQLNDTGEKL